MTELVAQGQRRERDGEGRPIAEFGNERVMKLPRNVINVLPQIRTEFDQDKLQELADSMPLAEDVDGLMHELMEPVIEGLHTEKSARQYLKEFNLANGTSYRVKDLIPFETFAGTRYIIHIAGERRLRAADLLIEKHGYSPESSILSTVNEDISYIEALPKQFVENNARVDPSAEDESRAMRRYINMMRVIEPKYTQADCARAFAVQPDKVREAMIFTDYPASMQLLAKDYPFSWVIEARDIYDEWLKYYQKNKELLKKGDAGDLFSNDDLTVGVSPNGSTTWTASDGQMFFESPEDVSTYEVETCFMRITAERLARRSSQGGRKNRDVRLRTQLDAIREMMQNELNGTAELALPFEENNGYYSEEDDAPLFGDDKADDEDADTIIDKIDKENFRIRKLAELFYRRRKMAASALFEASIRALWLLEARGDLLPDMRSRLGKYATTYVPFSQPNNDEEDIAVVDSSLVLVGS